MSLFSWLKCLQSNRGRALSLYKRGMAKAKRRDHDGAIEDYTTTIGMQDTPPDVRAMALYNRALVYVAGGDDPKGVDDLDLVLTLDDAPLNVKTMAKQKLARIETRHVKEKKKQYGKSPT